MPHAKRRRVNSFSKRKGGFQKRRVAWSGTVQHVTSIREALQVEEVWENKRSNVEEKILFSGGVTLLSKKSTPQMRLRQARPG